MYTVSSVDRMAFKASRRMAVVLPLWSEPAIRPMGALVRSSMTRLPLIRLIPWYTGREEKRLWMFRGRRRARRAGVNLRMIRVSTSPKGKAVRKPASWAKSKVWQRQWYLAVESCRSFVSRSRSSRESAKRQIMKEARM